MLAQIEALLSVNTSTHLVIIIVCKTNGRDSNKQTKEITIKLEWKKVEKLGNIWQEHSLLRVAVTMGICTGNQMKTNISKLGVVSKLGRAWESLR